MKLLKFAVGSVAVLALAGLAMPAMAADSNRVTFTKDVLPILQENCQNCHRSGGANYAGMIAPMAFTTYQEVRPWARSIAKQVAARNMPPWSADLEHAGQFSNERILTADEIETIVSWVESGAARGRPEDAPDPVVWKDAGTGWSVGTPDLIVKFPEPFFVDDDVSDLYVNIEVPITLEQFPRNRYIKSAEIKAGSEAVHHVIARPLGGMAPGNDPAIVPEGFGKILHTGETVTFRMHYHKEAGPGTGVWDQTSIGVAFHDDDADIKYRFGGGPANIGNMRFEIPPGVSDWPVGAAHTYEKDTMILSFMPHMHLRGKDARYTAYYPDGTSEVLLNVPEYDFNWQHTYRLAEPKWLPAGTRLEFTTHFDNSTERATRVGYNSERAIRFGGPTTDEMMLGWLSTSVLDPAEPLDGSSDE